MGTISVSNVDRPVVRKSVLDKHDRMSFLAKNTFAIRCAHLLKMFCDFKINNTYKCFAVNLMTQTCVRVYMVLVYGVYNMIHAVTEIDLY